MHKITQRRQQVLRITQLNVEEGILLSNQVFLPLAINSRWSVWRVDEHRMPVVGLADGEATCGAEWRCASSLLVAWDLLWFREEDLFLLYDVEVVLCGTHLFLVDAFPVGTSSFPFCCWDCLNFVFLWLRHSGQPLTPGTLYPLVPRRYVTNSSP